MQTDRTTKTLLFLIAAALWIGLLKSFLAPAPTIAQPVPMNVNIAAVGGRPVGPVLPVEGSAAEESRPLRVRVLPTVGAAGAAPNAR